MCVVMCTACCAWQNPVEKFCPKIYGLLMSIAVGVGVRDSAKDVIYTYSYVFFSAFEFPWLCKFSFPLIVMEMFTAC